LVFLEILLEMLKIPCLNYILIDISNLMVNKEHLSSKYY
jgi:hypothetical protein